MDYLLYNRSENQYNTNYKQLGRSYPSMSTKSEDVARRRKRLECKKQRRLTRQAKMLPTQRERQLAAMRVTERTTFGFTDSAMRLHQNSDGEAELSSCDMSARSSTIELLVDCTTFHGGPSHGRRNRRVIVRHVGCCATAVTSNSA